MKRRNIPAALAIFALPLLGQRRDPLDGVGALGRDRAKRMPDGRDRTLVILKQDAEKSTEDMARVIDLAKELLADVEKNKFHTVDVRSVRKADEIVKLVKRVKSRMVRYQ